MIVARVRRTIAERDLLPRGARVLVGCSGGPDSAALLAALCELSGALQLRIEAASVDHGLRQEAAYDVELARSQAAEVGVAFHPLRVEVTASGRSLQAQARSARYGALRSLGDRLGVECIAVGHTLDDQAETVLMRVLRGASIAGLSGIQARRSDGVVRPLIDCRRADVHAFAAARFAATAADPSNDDRRFLRTRVRTDLLATLRAEDPAVDVHLAGLADDAFDVRTHLGAIARELLESASFDDGTLSIRVLEGAPRAVRREALRCFLADRTGREPGRAQLLEVENLLRGRGEVLLGRGLRVVPEDATKLRIEGAAGDLQGGGLDAGDAGAKVVKQ